ncbi:hypothetical protein ABTK88_19930, partial [Acinetobacter baumannii]
AAPEAARKLRRPIVVFIVLFSLLSGSLAPATRSKGNDPADATAETSRSVEFQFEDHRRNAVSNRRKKEAIIDARE